MHVGKRNLQQDTSLVGVFTGVVVGSVVGGVVVIGSKTATPKTRTGFSLLLLCFGQSSIARGENTSVLYSWLAKYPTMLA
eukprot:CAMPEP_0118697374 /NCGR_PEP_ID=MMETSP0800-20121206/14470_1 /TAXON_ID=210618 ORGANISM="Striatella unipunctata, Strain CCMP2910" /NCGR_SAMPLE_ID=MMETSP0800 /ASSEMBLY_ACC=CAM_ASM_000638 /LENGTH=79 /DNA_ID=CAMNT_0006596797 /DNA_START=225 /DNA_END=464 /DNA_ORIENTATION=-